MGKLYLFTVFSVNKDLYKGTRCNVPMHRYSVSRPLLLLLLLLQRSLVATTHTAQSSFVLSHVILHSCFVQQTLRCRRRRLS